MNAELVMQYIKPELVIVAVVLCWHVAEKVRDERQVYTSRSWLYRCVFMRCVGYW